MAMAFYLIPFSRCKYQLKRFLCSHFAFIREIHNQMPVKAGGEYQYAVIVNQGIVRISEKTKIMNASVAVALLISIVLIGRQAVQYRMIKRRGIWNRSVLADKETEELFVKLKNTLKIKRRVQFLCSEYCDSPLTCGVMKPVVIFPAGNGDRKMDARDAEYILKHELVHIRHNDVLVKWICILVMALHWFNPFVYLLFREVSCVGEMFCDSIVVDGKEEEERKKYMDLILEVATPQGRFRRFGAGMRTESRKKIYKRRILEIKKEIKHRVFLSAMVAVLIGMAGGMTAMAYTKPRVLINEADDDDGLEIVFSTEPIEYEKLVSDYYFTADDGTVYDLSDMDGNDRAACVHNYSGSGTVTKHQKDGNGGCVVNTYNAFTCSYCGDVKVLGLINTVTYKFCPH